MWDHVNFPVCVDTRFGLDISDDWGLISRTCPQRVHNVPMTYSRFNSCCFGWLGLVARTESLYSCFSCAWCMTRKIMVFVCTPIEYGSYLLPTLQTIRPKRNLLVSCHEHITGFCFSMMSTLDFDMMGVLFAGIYLSDDATSYPSVRW